MKETAIQTLTEQDAAAAALYLSEQNDILAAASAFHETMKHAYWQMKDLTACILLAQEGIAFGSEQAKKIDDNEALEYEVRSRVKAMCYDLASFTWPGWDEEGFTITPEQRKLGLDAAYNNLHLAEELKKDALPHSRAHWVVGAQLLAAGEYQQAQTSFVQAAEYASQAKAQDEILLSQGFEQVARLLATPGQSDAQQALAEIKSQLQALEYGDFFIKQLADSLRVFG